MEALRAVVLGLLVQAAANVNNTYWDFVNGVDTATVICVHHATSAPAPSSGTFHQELTPPT